MPLFGTTSMIGSNWPLPLQAHRGRLCAPRGAVVRAGGEGDERRWGSSRTRLLGAVAGRQEVDVRPVGIGRDGGLPVVDHRVDRDLAGPARRGRGRGALEVGALPGLAGATLAERLLPGLDALLDALRLLLALLVRVATRVRVRCRRGESGPGDGAGVSAGRVTQTPSRPTTRMAITAPVRRPNRSRAVVIESPPRYRRRILQRPDRRSLRRGPGLENVVPGRAAS